MNAKLIVLLGLFVLGSTSCPPTTGEKIGLQKFFQSSNVTLMVLVAVIAIAVHIRQRGFRWV